MAVVGVVRQVSDAGFGFIEGDDPELEGEDVFFHVRELPVDARSISSGARVEFEWEWGDKGPRATSVTVAREAFGPRLLEALVDADETLTAGQIRAVHQAVLELLGESSRVSG